MVINRVEVFVLITSTEDISPEKARVGVVDCEEAEARGEKLKGKKV